MKMPRKSRRIQDDNDQTEARFDRLDQWWTGRDRGGERVLGSLRVREPTPDRVGRPASKAKARKP